jgi:hypothetical protein
MTVPQSKSPPKAPLSRYQGCPGSTNGNSTTILLGVASLNVTYPDGRTYSMVDFIGDETYSFALIRHSTPWAGVVVEYVDYNYPRNFPPYHVFLLVSK